MRHAALTIALAACGGQATSRPVQPTAAPAPQPAVARPALLPIQLDCRADRNTDIMKMSAVLIAPDCNQAEAFDLAASYFDMGARDGERLARQSVTAKVLLCVCENGTCSDEARAKFVGFAEKTATDIERQEGIGVEKVGSPGQCTRAAPAIELYKAGLWCALDKWPASAEAAAYRGQHFTESSQSLRPVCDR